MKVTDDISRRGSASIAGIGLLIMTFLAIFSGFFVFQKLIIQHDAAATVNNILSNNMLFRIGIIGYVIVIICDIIVAWALYVFLKQINKSLSLLAGWLRLVYAVIFGIALSNYLNALNLISGADYLKILEPAQLHANVMISLNAFDNGWSTGFIFFGLHLIMLGYLIFKSDYIPKYLGILLIIAGFSYFLESIGKILYPEVKLSISLITGWGELIFMFWLLWKCIKGFEKPAAA